MGSWSIWHWLIVLVIVLAVFGTKKLRNIGPDVGSAVREFKKALNGDEDKSHDADHLQQDEPAEPAAAESASAKATAHEEKREHTGS